MSSLGGDNSEYYRPSFYETTVYPVLEFLAIPSIIFLVIVVFWVPWMLTLFF